MGLIKAIAGAAGGVLADSLKDYFYCESLPVDVLVEKGHKRAGKRSSNTQGSDNIITTGSALAVADGQCMIIVEQGKVVDLCAEPGEYTYDATTEPSIFSGSLSEGIAATFKNIGKRFTFGGEAPMDQRIYYVNTKELIGNKYGTPNPVPFRVLDERAGIDIDVSVRCFGEYSFRIVDPILFYTNVCSNVTDRYTRDQLDSQMKTELLTALQPAFYKIGSAGIRYSAIVGHTAELADALNEQLSAKWKELRGIEIVSITFLPYFLCGYMDMFPGVMRGLGHAFVPMILSIIGTVGVRVFWIFVYFPSHRSLFELFLSYPISWLATIVLQVICFFFVCRIIRTKYSG